MLPLQVRNLRAFPKFSVSLVIYTQSINKLIKTPKCMQNVSRSHHLFLVLVKTPLTVAHMTLVLIQILTEATGNFRGVRASCRCHSEPDGHWVLCIPFWRSVTVLKTEIFSVWRDGAQSSTSSRELWENRVLCSGIARVGDWGLGVFSRRQSLVNKTLTNQECCKMWPHRF